MRICVILSKTPDGTKISGIVNSEEGWLRRQQDIGQLGKWAGQMEFILNKLISQFHRF